MNQGESRQERARLAQLLLATTLAHVASVSAVKAAEHGREVDLNTLRPSVSSLEFLEIMIFFSFCLGMLGRLRAEPARDYVLDSLDLFVGDIILRLRGSDAAVAFEKVRMSRLTRYMNQMNNLSAKPNPKMGPITDSMITAFETEVLKRPLPALREVVWELISVHGLFEQESDYPQEELKVDLGRNNDPKSIAAFLSGLKALDDLSHNKARFLPIEQTADIFDVYMGRSQQVAKRGESEEEKKTREAWLTNVGQTELASNLAQELQAEMEGSKTQKDEFVESLLCFLRKRPGKDLRVEFDAWFSSEKVEMPNEDRKKLFSRLTEMESDRRKEVQLAMQDFICKMNVKIDCVEQVRLWLEENTEKLFFAGWEMEEFSKHAVSRYEELQKDPFEEMDWLRTRAMVAIGDNDNEAEKLCQQLLAEYPDISGSHDVMGQLREAQGRYQEAAKYYSKALDMLKSRATGNDQDTLKHLTEKRDRALANAKV